MEQVDTSTIVDTSKELSIVKTSHILRVFGDVNLYKLIMAHISGNKPSQEKIMIALNAFPWVKRHIKRGRATFYSPNYGFPNFSYSSLSMQNLIRKYWLCINVIFANDDVDRVEQLKKAMSNNEIIYSHGRLMPIAAKYKQVAFIRWANEQHMCNYPRVVTTSKLINKKGNKITDTIIVTQR